MPPSTFLIQYGITTVYGRKWLPSIPTTWLKIPSKQKNNILILGLQQAWYLVFFIKHAKSNWNRIYVFRYTSKTSFNWNITPNVDFSIFEAYFAQVFLQFLYYITIARMLKMISSPLVNIMKNRATEWLRKILSHSVPVCWVKNWNRYLVHFFKATKMEVKQRKFLENPEIVLD